ncbi:bifunctional riboflavin kinase/FAD synthetase [Thermodesulfatator autotrophicus]|uniref:Riboflavin biosynthesis protein n=1 Tax=Thermodesulfatator autotrophicus TaxID=1795632 RepID=A0A177E9X9_9BACT|nr:bifunctional riboflavin kinase/FAD synthetase [Thermodesulfatator autotrophicus]OAG28743.1 bifunctional riboflavin kinase/FMN adenylyltransferase [Thermodesulfatator autotrophicus]
MKILRKEDLPLKVSYPVATIGNFDGVHLGHQALFRETVKRARAHQGHAIAVTFHPHPLQVLRPDKAIKLICSLEQKIKLIEKAGLDYLLLLEFNQALASLEPEEFVEDIFVKGLSIKELVVGYDYRFGKKRRGDTELLKILGQRYGFDVTVVPPQKVNGLVVSSSLIRELIAEGEVALAAKLLGRFYKICGQVIPGRGRGQKLLGFPTANLKLSKEKLLPKTGVYAVWVHLDGQKLPGVMNLGFNPTFGEGYLSAEVHIFDFSGDLYGQNICISFVERLRDEKKFSSPEELAAQIKRDSEKARQIFNALQ